jgi:hypothetical protein
MPRINPYEPNLDRDGSVSLDVSPAFLTAQRVSLAKQLLQKTDYVELRRNTPDRTLSDDWMTWREQLREVVRGVRMEIPEEPPRYANAPS